MFGNWNDPQDPPDNDIVVLVRVDDEETPIFTGNLDEGWRYYPMGGLIQKKVLGWMYFIQAAFILDGKK